MFSQQWLRINLQKLRVAMLEHVSPKQGDAIPCLFEVYHGL